MKKLIGLAFVAVLGIGGLAACSSDSSDYTKEDFSTDLQEEGGLTEEQANCVADGLEAKGVDMKQFGEEIDEDANPEDVLSEEDLQALTDVTLECSESTSGS